MTSPPQCGPDGAPRRSSVWRGLAWAGVSTLLAAVGLTAAERFRKKQRHIRLIPEVPPVLTDFQRLAQELAHEIRNPLTAINARLYKLQKRFPEGTPEFRDAVIIENEIKRLDQMLENFRRLGSVAAPQLMPVQAETVVREVCELLAADLEPRAVQVRWETIPGLTVRADPQQLKQVLINLVKNAGESILGATNASGGGAPPRKSGGDGDTRGDVWVRLRKERAELQGHSTPAVVFEVADNGPGIAPEVRSKILEPYFSTKEHGTGLGLALAARIIAQHGGALEIASRSGEGASFRVLLPEESHE